MRLLKERELLMSEHKDWKRRLEELEKYILQMMGKGNSSREIMVTKEGTVEILEC